MPTMKFTITRCGAALAALLISSVALASNHIVELAWSSDGRFSHQSAIPAGKFVEVCGKLTARETVRWNFKTSGPVDFNIHYHVGKDVVFPTQQPQVSSARDALKVEVAQDYCWMWTNKSAAPVTLMLELSR